MLIDCDRCVVRGVACGGCVVSVLLGGPPDAVDVDARSEAKASGAAKVVPVRDAGSYGIGMAFVPDGLDLDRAERAALDALAAGGLIPPLRLVLPDSATG